MLLLLVFAWATIFTTDGYYSKYKHFDLEKRAFVITFGSTTIINISITLSYLIIVRYQCASSLLSPVDKNVVPVILMVNIYM